MTSDVRTYIELSDITGIEFECQKCGTRLFHSINEPLQRIAEKCPSCFEPWLLRPEGPQFNEPISEQLKGWISAITGWQRTNAIYAKMRMQIKPVSK